MSDKLFAVVGKMHSGKTTFANALVELGYTRMAFADPVKDISADMLNAFRNSIDKQFGELKPRVLPIKYYDRDSVNKMKGHPAIRGLLQLVGTEIGRNWYGPDSLWVDLFERRLRNDRIGWLATGAYNAGDEYKVVNDDCRFPNEAERLKKMGFKIIKLVRDEEERLTSIKKAMAPNFDTEEDMLEAFETILSHPSETNVDLIDPDIVLQSITIEQLRTAAGHLDRVPEGIEYHVRQGTS